MNESDFYRKVAHMKNFLQAKIYSLAFYLELFISAILIVVILFLSSKLLVNIFDMSYMTSDEDVFTFFLENAMNLAVGVELVKMLCKHTPGTVVEVLLFAIARQIVVSHSSVINTFLGVACIVVLFATRKYLFLPHDEAASIVILRGSQTVRMANMLAKIQIPETEGKYLRDVMEKRIVQEGKTRAIGTCIDYEKFSLCIASISDDKITQVRVLKP